jgi:hypothetical protein
LKLIFTLVGVVFSLSDCPLQWICDFFLH